MKKSILILPVAVILLVAVVGLAVFAGGKEAGETESVKMIEWSSDGSSGYMPDIQSSADSTSSEATADPPAPHFPDIPADVTEDDGELAMSPDVYPYMLVNYKYTEKLESFGAFWDYVLEQTGETLDTMFKTVWKYKYGTSFSLLDIIDEFNIPKEEFVELNNRVARYNYLTEEEIDIIYSGDKKRIAEAFAQPYAIVTGDWEVYPLRWIIDNPADLYKEKGISFEVLETVVNKLFERERIYDDDKAALLARIEEYRKLQ